MPAALQAVRGMNDVLPDEAPLWQRFEDTARTVFERYGYRNLRVPIVEPTPLFVRGIGEHTDIVEKEMYTFDDKLNGDSLTLRPEATAGIVRAAIEHNLALRRARSACGPAGPMFRHERPQKGRYRQFHQLDVEALGFAGPDVDAEQIVMLARLWHALGARRHHARDQLDRRRRRATRASRGADRALRAARGAARRRCAAPPARQSAAHPRQQAPAAAGRHRRRAAARSTRWAPQSRAHFDGAAARCSTTPASRYTVESAARARARLLQPHGVRVGDRRARRAGHRRRRRPLRRPVRGSWAASPRRRADSRSASSAMILLLQAQGASHAAAPDAYVVHAGEPRPRVARRVAETLRDHGACVVVHAGGGSFKSQMKKADASGARLALIVGDDEAAAGTRRDQAAARRRRADRRAGRGRLLPRFAALRTFPRTNMAAYDLEEQDQIDELKAWWTRYGGTVTVGLVLGRARRSPACRAGAGTRQARRGRVGALHARSARPRAPRTRPRRRTRSRRSPTSYAGTGYAPRAALLYAKMLYDSGDRDGAKAQYTWVGRACEGRRAAGDRALSPRAGAGRREAVRRGARDARREASGRRSTACSPTCAAMRWPPPAARRRAHRVRNGAREARSQVAVPQLRAGEARRARQRCTARRLRHRPFRRGQRTGRRRHDGAGRRVQPTQAQGAARGAAK